MSIIREIKEEIHAAYREPSSRDLTTLALLFLAIPGGIGTYLLWWKGSFNGYYWIAAGVILGLCRLVPPLFRVIYRYWLSFSVVLGYFVSRTILTIIFFGVITPMGLIMRLTGKDPMERKLDSDAPTYWQPREQAADTSIERYEKQF